MNGQGGSAAGFTARAGGSNFDFRLAKPVDRLGRVNLKTNEHLPKIIQLDDPALLRGLRPGG